MKTHNEAHGIIVRDGKTTIASWQADAGHRPTVGDRIPMPREALERNPGYGRTAVVTRVGLNTETGEWIIEAAPECAVPGNRRAVVTLNASLIPEAIRPEVEAVVRSRLELPIVEWEDGFETSPILRLHEGGRIKASIVELNSRIRTILGAHLAPAGC